MSGKPYTDAEIAAGLVNPSPRMLATVTRLLRERDEARAERAACCQINASRADAAEARVKELEAQLAAQRVRTGLAFPAPRAEVP